MMEPAQKATRSSQTGRWWWGLLALSGVANITLAVWLVTQLRSNKQPPVPTELTVAEATNTAVEPSSAPEPDRNDQRMSWPTIASTNLTEYQIRLRVLGCPEGIIAAILETEINRANAARRRALMLQRDGDFWAEKILIKRKRKPSPTPEQHEATQELARLHQQQRSDLQQFAPDRSTVEAKELYRDDDRGDLQSSFLTRDKRELLAGHQKILGEMRDSHRSQRLPGPEADQRLEALQKEQDAELARALTEEELTEYRLRTSRYSGFAREIYGFTPTEQEHRAMVKLNESYAGQVPKAAWQELFGPTRHMEFERARDVEYHNLYKVGDRVGLPLAAVNQAYEMQRQAEAAAQAIRLNHEISAEEQAAALQQIERLISDELQGALGNRAYEMYQRSKH